MFDYGAYPIWYKYDNGVYENGFPNELKNADELHRIFNEINDKYTTLFINDDFEFSYRGFSTENERERFMSLLSQGIGQLKNLCGSNFQFIYKTALDEF